MSRRADGPRAERDDAKLRREQVLAYRRLNYTFQEIAELMEIHIRTAYRLHSRNRAAYRALLTPASPKRQWLQREGNTGVADERGQQIRSPTQGG